MSVRLLSICPNLCAISGIYSSRPTTRRVEREGFCTILAASIASAGYMSTKRIGSMLSAATTYGNLHTHSLDCSEDSRAAKSNLWTHWAPKSRSASVRLKRSTIPCWRSLPACPRLTNTSFLASNSIITPTDSRTVSTWRS